MKDIAIIGLLGRKFSGKSTAAKYLAGKYGADIFSFGTAVKDACHAFMVKLDATIGMRLSVTSEEDGISWTAYERRHFDDPVWKEAWVTLSACGVPHRLFTLRWLMQTLATEVVRGVLGREIWVRATMNALYARRADAEVRQRLFVIDDVRFIEEVDAIRANNGIIIKLTCTDDVVPEGAVHESEDIDKIPVDLIDEAVASHRSARSDHLIGEIGAAIERLFSPQYEQRRRLAAVRDAMQSPRG